MAGSVNRAILIGNLGRDPEIKVMPSGEKMASFSLATSEKWKDKSGEKQERTQWHNVVVWNPALAGIVESYVKKGSKLYIEGQIETRKYTDKEGAEKYITEIVLRPFNGEICLLSGGGEGAPKADKAPKASDAGPDGIEDDIPW